MGGVSLQRHAFIPIFGTVYPDFPSDPNKRREGGCGGRKGFANVVAFATHNI